MLSLFGKIKVEKYTGGKNVATKKQLRTEMKKKLSQVSEQSYLTLSNKIAKNVYVLEEWENAKVIFTRIFISLQTYKVKLHR